MAFAVVMRLTGWWSYVFSLLSMRKNFGEKGNQFALLGVIETTKNFVGERGLLNAFFNIKVEGE